MCPSACGSLQMAQFYGEQGGFGVEWQHYNPQVAIRPLPTSQQGSLPPAFTEVGFLFFVSSILVVVLCLDYKWETLYTYPTGLVSGIVYFLGASTSVQLG